jgi:hypothetical protein
VAASLSQFQLRSCLVNDLAERWSEWPPADAIPAHDASERTITLDVPVHAAAVPLLPGA